jgi:aconitate hydratase A / 2-methylisocitrate dehydratase
MPAKLPNPFGTRTTLKLPGGPAAVYSLRALEKAGAARLDRLPFSIRVLLENMLRFVGNGITTEEHVKLVGGWRKKDAERPDIPFMPSRVLLQDFTGVPCVVDLAAMRDAMARMAGDPKKINPLVPCDLVIDHSVQVDYFGTKDAFRLNVEREFERNKERYQLLKFAQRAFDQFRVVPPGTGIVHQVNLEYLAPVVHHRDHLGAPTAFPDTVVGTDSHTTMINGLGVLGWGVGGIEAEAVMLGQPYFMLIPDVVGVKLSGQLPEGATATDLVLVVTQMLRKRGVVDKFVEFFGTGLSNLPLADRATIANMAPEYGATMGFFPVDAETLRYLERTGRDREIIERVERYSKDQELFRTDATPDPEYTDVLDLNLSTVEPSLAGPRRPQDRVRLQEVKPTFEAAVKDLIPKGSKRAVGEENGARWAGEGGASPAVAVATAHPKPSVMVTEGKETFNLFDGAVVIAAITSCTNTSNPSVMIGAGLLAKKAAEKGLGAKPWVKTSMAPGSRVVTDYLEGSGLMPYLDKLRFQVVGYGCTTCIGNSGPLPEAIGKAVEDNSLVVAAVLSGNRNFEARIHPQVRANYLASPMLVVAYALAGRVDIDLTTEAIGWDQTGRAIHLKDIWPTPEEIRDAVTKSLKPELFRKRYGAVFDGDDRWRKLSVPGGSRFKWDPDSTYVREPPFFVNLPRTPGSVSDIPDARVLVSVGDSVTTDHISPAGAIGKTSPAGQYLMERGVQPLDFNTYGARRGNHEVMMRGTFGNVRIKNLLAPGKEGFWTTYLPTAEVIPIYEAAMRYVADKTPLVVLAGKEYGTGSSRDWAAKGTLLLGVKAVIAESFERIHRSNLVGMGVLPLVYADGKTRESLGLTGKEFFSITGIAEGLAPRKRLTVTARTPEGRVVTFAAIARLDSPIDIEYYRHGGILQRVLRQMVDVKQGRRAKASSRGVKQKRKTTKRGK